MEIIFGLGSNLGDRLENLREAIRRLQTEGFKLKSASDVFETEPWGGVEQPNFLNACLKMEFEKKNFDSPLEILSTIKKIENEMGRIKNVRWGARLIDIDILVMKKTPSAGFACPPPGGGCPAGTRGVTFSSPTLTIPHKEIPNRAFVLYPLAQLAPEWREMAEKFPPPSKFGPASLIDI